MYKRVLAMAFLAGAVTPAAADTLDAYLSEETAQFTYLTGSERIGFGGADLSMGLFFDDEDDVMLSTGLSVAGVPAGERPLTFGVGAKAYFGFLDEPDRDFQSIGLGGEVRYTIPANTPMYVSASAHYAPKVTTFGDADDFYDLGLRYELEVTPGARGFIGYRLMEADLERGGDFELDDNIHFGVRLDF
ncbi:YfaZ family outer membrane protein [Ectothiorhodospira mobilis]|uniref:YfaZ family outer membrane protein n=1 Tax=Ectothiorhodospira mobilis TaxID=195064 RepID=UPI001EE932B9|nr:YfaZ family outer membrane protein [Ectothiorhodospira mobilis]MCG5536305.1 YfaZ family protein [Ectothiorhodospira mobilis]